MQKKKKKKKIQRITMRIIIIIETSGWRQLKEKISSFLAMNIRKYTLPAQKVLNFLKLPQTKNRKLYFSHSFKKWKYFFPNYSHYDIYSNKIAAC